jgi:hypothetical protein
MAHPFSYAVGTRSSFPGGKASGSWSWHLTSIYCRGSRMRASVRPLPNTPWWLGAQLKNSQGKFYTYLGYGLDDHVSGVQFPAWAGNFSLNHRVQNSSGVHPASYPVGTRGSFLWVKRSGREADHFHLVAKTKNEWRYTSTSPIRLHGVLLS